MILIIHGKDIEQSRNYYFLEKNKYKNPIILEGENLSLDVFYQNAQNKSFFDEQITIIVENFFSKNKINSAELKKIANFINKSKNLNLIFWEQTELAKTALALIKKSEIKNFTIPQKLFVFLDNLKPDNSELLIKIYHQLRESQEAELILFMLIRQFRLFLSTSSKFSNNIDEIKKMQPWQISKLSNQIRFFTKQELNKYYSLLFEIENNQKTGKVGFSLDTSIDFFLASL